ncbi:MAG: prepilin-type N-terminal cleavage/methylation domain-containing protein [Deltaproteobacteria bacterium]|nr:prepilin-type N-terminal cleavage/methylation domain-containing protein [Deltaproteobacteria bacterium]
MKKRVTDYLGKFIKKMSVRHSDSSEASRGFTLIEIMIVIVIVGMMATGVTIGLVSRLADARMKAAHQESCTIRSAVILYMAQNGGECPSIEDLKSGGFLDTKMRTLDPWNNDYNVDCADGDPDVYSTGKDGNGRVGCDQGEDKE